jgi:hypothetical protein
MKRQRKALSPQLWQTCDDPTKMLRWCRHVANPQRYLQLCCAVVRNWPGGIQTELGRQVLQAIEEEAKIRPLRNVRLGEVLGERFPETFRAGEFGRLRTLSDGGRQALAGDANWAWLFAQANFWIRQTSKAVPNLLFSEVLLAANQVGRQECHAEIEGLRKEIQSQPTPPGLMPPADAERVRGAILARLDGGNWRATPSSSATWWQAGVMLSQQRSLQRQSQTRALVCGLIREVFGDPTNPWRARPEWLSAHGGIVRRMAEHVELTGDFGELPILGDALEDAGCCDEAVLQHCRGGGPHVPGCWVVGALLRHAKPAEEDAQAGE